MSKKIIVWSLLGLLLAVPASAQNPNMLVPSPQTAGALSSGSCTSNTNCAVWDITNNRSVTLQVSGTFSGTLTFEGTTDGTNWVSIQMMALGTGLPSTTTTTTGQFSLVNTGLVGIRARMTSYSSGTASVWAQLGQGGSIPIISAGSVLPSGGCVSWNGDTWLQRTAAGKLGISGASCGGANNGTLSLGVVLVGDGTAAAPSYSFTNYTNLGLYVPSANVLGVSVGGTGRWAFNSSGTFYPILDGSYDLGSPSQRPDRIYSTKFTSRIASGNGGTAGNRSHANISIGTMGTHNDIGQITFGYASDGSSTYQPVALYAKTVSASGSTKASFNIAIRNATTDTAPTTAWGIDPWGSVGKAGQTYASLSAPSLGYGYAVVTDSNTAVWGATIAGGGSNVVLAFYNGTNWTVAAK